MLQCLWTRLQRPFCHKVLQTSCQKKVIVCHHPCFATTPTLLSHIFRRLFLGLGSKPTPAAQDSSALRDANGFLLGQPRSDTKLELAVASAKVCTLAPVEAGGAPVLRWVIRCGPDTDKSRSE